MSEFQDQLLLILQKNKILSKVVKPYSEEEEKKTQVRTMFNAIAPAYDFLNHFLSLGIDRSWRKKAIKKLEGTGAKKILDVATGTADLAITADKILDVNHVTGVDISDEMLDVGRKKLTKKKLNDKILLLNGDSEALPFEDGEFDAAMVAFGVRNFQDLDKGLAEMRRVIKDGGKMVVLEFTKPRFFLFKFGFNLYFKYILPTIGRLTSKDPKAYKYLYESVQAFPDYDKFVSHMEKAGLKNNEWESLSLGICAVYTGYK